MFRVQINIGLLTCRTELWLSLQARITFDKPDLIFMAAAVSDFSPIRQEGKISSDQDELVVRMRRNPKILASLRKICGVETFLVGFKLPSGASREKMIAAARKQLKDCRLNLVVANDLSNLEPGRHAATFVTPEGGAIDAAGTKDEVAERLNEIASRLDRIERKIERPLEPQAAPHDK